MMGLFKKKQQPQQNELEVWFADDFMRVKDLIAPPKIEESKMHMDVGGMVSRTYVIIDYPSYVKPGWMKKLYEFNGNIVISKHVDPQPAEKMINNVSKSIGEIETQELNPKLSARRKRELKKKKESAEKLLDSLIDGDDDFIFNVHLYVHIQAESITELEKLAKKLKTVFHNVRLKPHIPQDQMMEAFESVLPLNENELPEYTQRNMDANALASMFPYSESEIYMESGYVKGIQVGSRKLVVVDQFELPNHNEFVLGASGFGKSGYMKMDMLRSYMNGIRIFVIDPEREYGEIMKAMDGQVVVVSPMIKVVINPMEVFYTSVVIKDENLGGDGMEYKKSFLHQRIARLNIFFRLVKKDLTPIESALIEEAIIETYANYKTKNNPKGINWDTDFSKLNSKDFPTFTELLKQLQQEDELRNFCAIFKSYVTGAYSKMFNGHTNVNLKKRAICFDLKDLEDDSDVQPVAYFNVLNFLWDMITKDNVERKRLYIDEAHILADPKNPKALKFLFNIWKRIRKYMGGATAATQQIADLLSAIEGGRNYGKAIIGNSAAKFLLNLEPKDISDLIENNVISLSEEEIDILSNGVKREGIYIAGKDRVHMKVELTDYELELINPEAYKKKVQRSA